MAMITISGYPCSGKSTRANQLAQFLEKKLAREETAPQLKRMKVVVINDESLGIGKEAYDNSQSEKPARATLFSSVVRSLGSGKDSIVIVDSMNYIKGSRYQMYCAAREVGCRICTVYVATPPDKCLDWNSSLPSTSSYSPSTIENLLTRFEEPSSTVRWDSPLFTVAWDDPPLDKEGNEESERIWEQVSEGRVKRPNEATVPVLTSSTSYLTLLDSLTTLLISSLLLRQTLSPLSGPTTLSLTLPSSKKIEVTLEINKNVNMAVLQRLKRQFCKIHTKKGVEMEEEGVVRLWGEYLEGELR